MLTVTQSARDYFSRLLSDQPEGTGLRIRAIRPGTPEADCELNYCAGSEALPTDEQVDCQAFVLFVDGASRQWLDDALIDFETDDMGGQLTIKAPGLKGSRPGDDAPLQERVQWVLDARINPMVASHGGQVFLVDITEEREVVLQFGGGCHGCGMVDVTLKQGVESTLRAEVPEVQGVRDVTDHSTGENPYFSP